jgi:hypothetical protein
VVESDGSSGGLSVVAVVGGCGVLGGHG